MPAAVDKIVSDILHLQSRRKQHDLMPDIDDGSYGLHTSLIAIQAVAQQRNSPACTTTVNECHLASRIAPTFNCMKPDPTCAFKAGKVAHT